MRPDREITLLISAIASLAACTGVDPDRGLDEPLRVSGAAFEQGELPGEPPLAEGAPPDAPKADPHVTLIESVNNVFAPGQTGKSMSGRATGGAAAIAVRFADLGSGYWVVPAGSLPEWHSTQRRTRMGATSFSKSAASAGGAASRTSRTATIPGCLCITARALRDRACRPRRV